MNCLARFHCDESGAVTVDWVVLAAAIVGLGVAVIGVVADSTLGQTGTLAAKLDDTGVMEH